MTKPKTSTKTIKASQYERDNLALYVESVPLFKAAQNVNSIGKADFVYPIGSSGLSATLHGASILLRVNDHWDWFINLSAADYPLVTQDASQYERYNLARFVVSVPLFKAAQNVNFIGEADFVYPLGSSGLSATLHGASIPLRVNDHWDWFSNLSSADYPLVTQDDLLHILSYMPKDLNFVNHSSYIGWRESRKLKPIVVDPGLFLEEEDEVFYATQKRELPDAYRLFSGSSCTILSRKFIEFCIMGTDNLPRTLLMYLSNSPSAASVYFPTILCNSRKFNKTTINRNIWYASFNSRQEARPLNSSDFNDLVMSGAAFATPFEANDPILDQIDRELLHHEHNKPVPGGWCLGDNVTDKCTLWGDAEVLRPGPGSKRLEKSFVQIFTNDTFRSSQCIYE
ncbi:hypothetical protein T459_07585 [Capsicum annuum]|uniref:Beta-glucuronosyltransferase GlcAT14A n=1 Tax=Capsicum annuum TaxID=4072 RepID=A0A2G2ZU26_CAPAN|nr:hypothetical protein T459_07585 [Capsicum annuum]